MKKILFLTLFLNHSLVFAQQTLYPVISDKPDISQQAQDDYAVLKSKYNRIISKQQNTLLSKDEKKWLQDNEIKVVDGDPFSTIIELDPESWGDIAYMKQVSSSSHLKPSKNSSYEVMNTQDSDLRTAWATNKNKGIDQEIRFTFNAIDGIKVNHIDIHNGYQKSEQAWKDNSRAKKIEVSVGGKSTYILMLLDTIKKQRFNIRAWPLSPDENLDMVFKVLEVYPGKKYQDLCISEIDFGGTDH